MKLVVPHTGELHAADARLIHLAEFLGVDCEPLRLANHGQPRADYIEGAVRDQNSCLVLNPRVMREWLGGDVLPPELVSSFTSRFPFILVHALTLDSFATNMIAAISSGRLHAVRPISDAQQPYDIGSDTKDICGSFAGLSFGPINASNDHVLTVGTDDGSLRKLICIGGLPHMAAVNRGNREILFLASEDTADVHAEIASDSVFNYFSRLVPHAMALRHIFGEECWRPCRSHASILIDDPLLRSDYGYLNFASLLRLMEKHNFHTTISFIPHNYRRSSARIIRMFRENPHRLSICFHGNDHTEAELGSTNTALLNTVLGVAERRMESHEQATGLHCDKVMVFPQDNYSVEAMEVLKSRNFHAASSSPYPVGNPVPLTIADLAQPAVVRYGGLPLFTRTFIRHNRSQDIAFNLFFGKPILIGEHHDAFKHPEALLDFVQNVNSLAPGISWSGLESIVDNTMVKRRRPDGAVQVRPYSRNVLITNDSLSAERFSIEWGHVGQSSLIEKVLRDGNCFPDFEFGDAGIRVQAELPAGASQIFSVIYRNGHAIVENPGLVWDAKVFLRRRLSEVRDNYLSKNEHVLTAAKTLHQRLLK
jgi:hypothetical protein